MLPLLASVVALNLLLASDSSPPTRPKSLPFPRRGITVSAFVPVSVLRVARPRHRSKLCSSSSSSSSSTSSDVDAGGPSRADAAAAAASATTQRRSQQKSKDLECQLCGERFASRNALFRHLRSDVHADATGRGGVPNGGAAAGAAVVKKGKIAVLFGYDCTVSNEEAADLVRDALVAVVASSSTSSSEGYWGGSSAGTIELGKATLASSASARNPCIAQEADCPASSDVLVVNYQSTGGDGTAIDIGGGWDRAAPRLVADMNAALREEAVAAAAPAAVRILATESVPMRANLHAERSATQRSYHYLLPLSWLEGGREASRWCVQNGKVGNGRGGSGGGGSKAHQKRGSGGPTPAVLRRLKESLRAAVGVAKDADVTAAESSKDDVAVDPAEAEAEAEAFVRSPGRFGSLWKKRKRCWHNFADPALGGLASPSNAPVWRCVDRASVVEFLVEDRERGADDDDDDDDNVVAVIEFTGDGFVLQQVRRLVGTAVAMTNGWLSPDFVDVATRPDVVVETPLAPSGRSYFFGARFHFHELSHGALFSGENGDGRGGADASVPAAAVAADEWLNEIRSGQLVQREQFAQDESQWLRDLEDGVAPHIRVQIEQIGVEDVVRRENMRRQALNASEDRAASPVISSVVPPVYKETLSLLRGIAQDGKWPSTSVARSRVIRSPGIQTSGPVPAPANMRSTFTGQRHQCGSFTIVNKDRFDGPIPQGNELFPDLVQSVFELEGKLVESLPQPLIANGTQKCVSNEVRPPSTHCAINRNAEFTPHVDSGEGLGQSLSMLVGLGDFAGGRLVVEGASYDVRHKPLEFNGWKQRHWTEPFTGERFALVWFTPELKTGGKSRVSTNQGFRRDEDVKAEILAQAHDKQLISYPPLRFRRNSTDALVVNEILDVDKGCAYECLGEARFGQARDEAKQQLRVHDGEKMISFSPRGHRHVLDIGAHIGVFTRYALSVGCHKVTAYEPEVSNINLLKQNTSPSNGDGNSKVQIHTSAVAQGEAGLRNLVRARSRNDGTLNTWRHSLESYSQYVDKSTELPSAAQESVLTRSQVPTVPLFDGALMPGMTFCKLDCEGAELDILLSPEAAKASSWLNVTHLVFEWSFTKERRVELFHQAARNLEDAGFRLMYEGMDSWWDTQANIMWPFHNDLVIFAVREDACN